MTSDFLAEGEAGTISYGRKLAARISPGQCVYFHGDLGAGKTTLVRGLLSGLGISEIVNSPTFTIMNEYHCGTMRIFHLDLYRIEDPQEVEFLGLGDLFTGDSVLLIEWPDRGNGYLPPPDHEVFLDYLDEGHRRIRI